MQKLMSIANIYQEANAPNIRRLKLIDVESVLKIKYPYLYNNPALLNYELGQTAVMLKAASKLINIGFLSGLATYSENMEEIEAGTSFTNSVNVSTKIDNPNNVLAIELMLQKGFIGFTEDRNGRCKVLGTIKQPLRLSTLLLNVGSNERTLTWQCKTKSPSFFIPSIKNEDIILGEFSNEFSNDFFI